MLSLNYFLWPLNRQNEAVAFSFVNVAILPKAISPITKNFMLLLSKVNGKLTTWRNRNVEFYKTFSPNLQSYN